MATYIKLERAPIKEIIYTISFKENIEIDKLENFESAPELTSIFPIIDNSYHTEVNEHKTNVLVPTANISVDGFILRDKNPPTKILQARRGSFSLHRLDGYQNFDTLISEFQSYWNIFVKCCGDLTVNALTVRYLNFIELEENELSSDLITIRVQHPFGDSVKNSFTQHRFTYAKEPSVRVTVVSTMGKNENKDGIILDIILNKTVEEKEDRSFDFSDFFTMRGIKNEIFFKCITEKTINKYTK